MNFRDRHDYVTSGMFNECGIDPPENTTPDDAIDTTKLEPAFNIERHTAILCKHSPAALQETISEIVKHYAPNAPNSLTIELASTFSQLMWDHADEIAAAYRDILRRQNG